MEKINPAVAVMAAGLGRRFGGRKQFEPVDGHLLLEYTIHDALQEGFGHVVILLRKEFEDDFRENFGRRIERGAGAFGAEVGYVFQESVEEVRETFPFRRKMWGTGQAALFLKDAVSGLFAVINADDHYGREAFRLLSDFFKDPGYDPCGSVHAMTGYLLKNVISPHGRVARGLCRLGPDGFLESIVEEENIIVEGDRIIAPDGDGFRELDGNIPVSMNFWGFNPTVFTELESGFREFRRAAVARMDPDGEFYLSDFIGGLLKSGKIRVKVLMTAGKWFGMTYREDHEAVEREIRKLKGKSLYPEKLWR